MRVRSKLGNATGAGAENWSSKHALEVARRRAHVAELAASGKDLRECEELLKQEGFLHTDHAKVKSSPVFVPRP